MVDLVREGAIGKDIDVGGFGLSASFDGKVESHVILLSEGTASAAAFVGATATATPTGFTSHELFGTADVTTEGFLSGQGSATASASGKASYDVTREGATSEVWGEVDGTSSLSLEGSSSDSLASTAGQKNGLHAESRVLSNRRGEVSDSATSSLSAYASAMNGATAQVDFSGQASSGGWDPTSTDPKVKLSNENVATLTSGTIKSTPGETNTVEAPGSGDAADLSAVIESTAARNTALYSGLQTGLYVSGGPSSYASAVKSSSSDKQTFSRALIEDPLWGSVARQPGRTAQEWGKVDETGSGAYAREAGAYALSFAKIEETTDLLESSGVVSSRGNLSIAVSTEVSGTKNAVAGAIVDGSGEGDMWTNDGYMFNMAGYIGDSGNPILHYAYISSEEKKGELQIYAKNVYLTVEPDGSASLSKPFAVNTKDDPMYAWASTEGWYFQAH
jgi:hypothetical protein